MKALTPPPMIPANLGFMGQGKRRGRTRRKEVMKLKYQ
jgi:hypothetical protein